MRNEWTMGELEELKRMSKEGYGRAEIARKLGRDPENVSVWAKKLGLPKLIDRREERKCLNQSKCWECARSAAKTCAWARDFEPVEGWEAEYRPVVQGNGKYRRQTPSYFIRDCPEFVEG